MIRLCVLISVAFCVWGAAAPLGSPEAVKGGAFVVGLPTFPKSLLYYLSDDETIRRLQPLLFDSLLETDQQTNQFLPLLASSWNVSKDQLTFTFKLDPRARFSDGRSVTSDDVKFTWDLLLNPKNMTAPFQSYYSDFEKCTAVDRYTIRFSSKKKHFKTLEKLGSLFILPKHFYALGDFNKAFHTKALGSGPYLLESVQTGEKIILKRNPDYWAAKIPYNLGRYNFDRLVFRHNPDPEVQHEIFKRGDLDYFFFRSSKMWAIDTNSPLYQKNYIKKLKIENLLPSSMQGIWWNLRRPLFRDRRVRLALSYLMDRERWIRELFYNQYILSTGVVSPRSEYHAPDNLPLRYDPKRARALLKEAGWGKLDSSGLLIKDGLRFEFDIITDTPQAVRYLTHYQEELRKHGIRMNIRVLDSVTAVRLVEDRKFDARADLGWSREAEPSDFSVLWGSGEADTAGSSNLTGYRNPSVDKLAKKIDETFDRALRIPLVRELDLIISWDQPMSFTWEATYFRVAYWNKFGFPGQGYFDHSDWRNAFQYWWLDPEKEKKLKIARATFQPLR